MSIIYRLPNGHQHYKVSSANRASVLAVRMQLRSYLYWEHVEHGELKSPTGMTVNSQVDLAV